MSVLQKFGNMLVESWTTSYTSSYTEKNFNNDFYYIYYQMGKQG